MGTLPRGRPAVRAMAGAAAVALGASLVACADEPTEIGWPGGTPPPPPSPPPAVESYGASADPAEAEAIAEILDLVNAFHEVEVASYADPQPPHFARRDLSPYLADPLLARTLSNLADMAEAGIVYEGRPTWDPVVAELRMDDAPPTAVVRDCVEAVRWQAVFAETGDVVAGDARPDRYVLRLDVKRYDDRWLLHDGGIEVDAEC